MHEREGELKINFFIKKGRGIVREKERKSGREENFKKKKLGERREQ
jgi:hypothetical protein